MRKIIVILSFVLLICIIVPATACAEASIAITAKEAVLMSDTGEVLFEHNSKEKRPIASMTKIMTLLCAYDAINEKTVSLNDDVVVSARAASMGGSQVFLDANSTYKMSDLIKSIIVCSANDSCVAVAEHMSGSVENFVEAMNKKAQQLKLENTHFENCTGLPAVSQFSCAYDVGIMLSKLIENKHYFECASVWMEDFVHPSGRVTGMTNTNKLVRFYDGCDGGKTGFTNEAQHCLAATAKRGDTRVIAVVVGAPDSKTRFAEVSQMFNYAFANYENKVYAKQGEVAGQLQIVGGKQKHADVAFEHNMYAFGAKGSGSYNVVCELNDKVKAPASKGDVVGQAKLCNESGVIVQTTNIVLCTDVQAKTVLDYFKELVL